MCGSSFEVIRPSRPRAGLRRPGGARRWSPPFAGAGPPFAEYTRTPASIPP